jgi:hypothetical protein
MRPRGTVPKTKQDNLPGHQPAPTPVPDPLPAPWAPLPGRERAPRVHRTPRLGPPPGASSPIGSTFGSYP